MGWELLSCILIIIIQQTKSLILEGFKTNRQVTEIEKTLNEAFCT